MPNNVKSCKKIDEKAQTAKFTVLQGEISSAVLKTWKTRKTKTWITQFFQILYAIQGTTMSTLTSQGFRKCGTFWVYDFLKGSYWLSKSSQISKKKWVRGSVPKKSHGHNFDFSGLARNQRLTNRVGSTLIPWRARKIKIVAVSFCCDAAFCFRKKWKNY